MGAVMCKGSAAARAECLTSPMTGFKSRAQQGNDQIHEPRLPMAADDHKTPARSEAAAQFPQGGHQRQVMQDGDQGDSVEAPVRVAPGEVGFHDGDRRVVGEALHSGAGHPGVGFKPGDGDRPTTQKRGKISRTAPDVEDVVSLGCGHPAGSPGAVMVVVAPWVPLIETVEVGK